MPREKQGSCRNPPRTPTAKAPEFCNTIGSEADLRNAISARPLLRRLCCKTRVLLPSGFAVGFCHDPCFSLGIRALRHQRRTRDLRRTSMCRQGWWTAEQLGETPQVLRGCGEQDLVPRATEASQS